MLYPDAFAKLSSHIPAEEISRAGNLPLAYYRRLQSSDAEVRREAARTWNEYELNISKVKVPASDLEMLDNDDWSLSHAVMETHYFINNLFVEEGQLLRKENVDKMRHIPGRSRP